MNSDASLFPIPDDPLDRTVRSVRDSEAAKLDAKSILVKVHSNLSPIPSSQPRVRFLKRWSVTLAIAASLLIAVFFILPTGQVSAEEARIQAKEAHQFSVDRAYRVRAELAPEIAKKLKGIETQKEALIWTRGDRFCVFFNDDPTYGQDEQGRVWLKLTNDKGIRYDADEIPEVVKEYLAIRSVHWVSLLDTVLKDCQLIREESDSPLDRILAKPRKGKAPFLESAEIVIDPRTYLVHRLVLHRKLFDESIATITFEYQSQENKSPDYYQLESHLNANGQVYDRGKPGLRRKELLKHHLGMILDKSL